MRTITVGHLGCDECVGIGRVAQADAKRLFQRFAYYTMLQRYKKQPRHIHIAMHNRSTQTRHAFDGVDAASEKVVAGGASELGEDRGIGGAEVGGDVDARHAGDVVEPRAHRRPPSLHRAARVAVDCHERPVPAAGVVAAVR